MTTSTAMVQEISIHAPREGGDRAFLYAPARHQIFQSTPPARGATLAHCSYPAMLGFQSTPPARGATRNNPDSSRHPHIISIHAPREGGDASFLIGRSWASDFNPRPPRGGRPKTPQHMRFSIGFQSTPPARGATRKSIVGCTAGRISIHAPREGGDFRRLPLCNCTRHFNPRPPRGGRPKV